jgi:uncharacterized membrane-anchored protein YitT (DUF2179 family)
MTRTTIARIAGVTFLAYIAVGIGAMMLHGKATRGDDVPAQLASISQRASFMQTALVLDLLCAFAAIILGVTLYALTREQDPVVAMFGLVCRGAEGIVAGVSLAGSVGLLWASKAVASNASNAEATNAIGAYLLGVNWSSLVAATFFAAGSTAFAWLFLRGRMIPASLAWLGVISSALLVVALPLQLGRFLSGSAVQFLWIPMAVFEIWLAVLLIVKGVRTAS